MQATASTQPDSWENRVEQAAKQIGITPAELEEVLAKLGVTKNDADCLEVLSDEEALLFGDIQHNLPEKHRTSVGAARLRRAIGFLRGPKNVKTDPASDARTQELRAAFGIKPSLSHADVADLLKYYVPSRPTDPITVELKRRYPDQPVIAFKPDSKEVAVEETIEYITGLEQGQPEEETILVDGLLVELQTVGTVPDATLEEDPLFPGEPLKGGKSRRNYVNWTGIALEVRQFFRIMLELEQINPDDRRAVATTVRDAKQGGIKALTEFHPEVELEFRKRKTASKLPTLTLQLSDLNGKGKNDPMHIGHRRY